MPNTRLGSNNYQFEVIGLTRPEFEPVGSNPHISEKGGQALNCFAIPFGLLLLLLLLLQHIVSKCILEAYSIDKAQQTAIMYTMVKPLTRARPVQR